MTDGLKVSDFLLKLSSTLLLTSATGSDVTGGSIFVSDVWRPGLLLAGFERGLRGDRVQLLGDEEMSFLDSLDDSGRRRAIDLLCAESVPCVVVADGRQPQPMLLETASSRNIAVLVTKMDSDDFTRAIESQLDDLLAPQTAVHATLVDVYGVGLLFTGKSGIGKSECGLDLVANGHRLVADDVVRVMRTRKDYLIGYGSELLKHYMEIRGIGIIDVQAMFGTRAIRQRKRIEVEVKLAAWSDLKDYERLGFEDEKSDILGVSIPAVTLPLVLGKNITVISEVVALNYLLKLRGINAARNFDLRQRRALTVKKDGVLGSTRGDDE
ncbi:MAG: HPr(Ser) kinase/phosphatase [Candidatus Eisenbacteria bacterium]|nr:HPr(Ser) kinase/phosphatase [Candidatus Eisenbacteria bacterium]